MAAFFLYVGLEQSAGAWAYSFLTEVRGLSLATAGTWVTLYWSGLTAGRVVFGFVANRWRLDAMVRGALVAIAAAAGLMAIDPFPAASAIGLAVLGFACGPIFPSLIAATPARLGPAHAANGVGFQVAAAACGQALIPWAVGGVAQHSSLAVLGPALLGFAVALIAVHEALVRFGSVRGEGDPVTRADTQTRWDAAQYARFERERAQPFHDLVARIPPGVVRRAADLGCGSGALTRTLLDRWPAAQLTGVDSSETMLAAAAAHAPSPRLRFAHADLRSWTPDAALDRIVSNAVLQWVDGHAELLARLVGFLAPGGALAVQMPHNDDSPTHETLRALWRDPRFAAQLGDPPSERRVAEASWYGERLLDLGCQVEVWETVYLHRMEDAEAIVEWVKGTALRPVLSRLDAAATAAFLAAYAERIRAAYPSGPHGTWFPFRRLFFVASLPGA